MVVLGINAFDAPLRLCKFSEILQRFIDVETQPVIAAQWRKQLALVQALERAPHPAVLDGFVLSREVRLFRRDRPAGRDRRHRRRLVRTRTRT